MVAESSLRGSGAQVRAGQGRASDPHLTGLVLYSEKDIRSGLSALQRGVVNVLLKLEHYSLCVRHCVGDFKSS